MDSSTSEFGYSQGDSHMSKFMRYNKNTSVSSSSLPLKEDIFANDTDSDKRIIQQNTSSSCNLKSSPLIPSNTDDLTPKVPQDLLSLYTTSTAIKMPSGFPTEKLKLSILDLSGNNLDQFPQEILSLDSLRLLRLDSNRLTEIPTAISKLSNLEIFTLSYNFLKSLPSTFFCLSNLKELNLEHNMIENITDEIKGLKNLRILNLYHNILATIPCAIKDFAMLKEFHFEWFHYTKPQLPIIQKGLDGKDNIEKLKTKLKELYQKKVKGMSFRNFLECFSSERVTITDADNLERTVLHHACLNEDLSVIKYICNNVPELNDITDRDDLTPFALSLLKDKTRSYKYLMTQKIKIAQGGGKFGSPLHIASKKMNLELVKEIINAGADVNKMDSIGNIPLHYAVSNMAMNYEQAIPVVQYLLDYDSNCNARNKENWTPLHLIARKGATQPLEWIISYNNEVKEIYGGGQVFNINKKGGAFKWTALHIAAYTGSYKMVELLGQAKADFFKVSSHGYTPKAMVRRDGLVLNLLSKYEKEYIKRKLFPKKRVLVQSPMLLNTVQTPTLQRTISFASKNKFKGPKPIDLSQSATLPKTALTYVGKNEAGGLQGSKAMSIKRFFSDYEISPETEAGKAHETIEEMRDNEMGAMQKLFTSTEAPNDLYLLTSQLNNQTKSSTANLTQAFQNQSIKQKNTSTAMLLTNIDIETYERRLQNDMGLGIHFYRKELAYIMESLTHPRIEYAEKMKLFLAIRILYKVILNNILKIFDISVSKESLPFVLFDYKCCNSVSYSQGGHFRKEQIAQVMEYYNLVPEGLTTVFNCLDYENHNNHFIKQNICKILGDINYFIGLEFFDRCLSSNQENILVVMEIKKIIASFKSNLERHQPQKTNIELLKKQYAKTLSPKINFKSAQVEFIRSPNQLKVKH